MTLSVVVYYKSSFVVYYKSSSRNVISLQLRSI